MIQLLCVSFSFLDYFFVVRLHNIMKLCYSYVSFSFIIVAYFCYVTIVIYLFKGWSFFISNKVKYKSFFHTTQLLCVLAYWSLRVTLYYVTTIFFQVPKKCILNNTRNTLFTGTFLLRTEIWYNYFAFRSHFWITFLWYVCIT